MAEIDIEVKQGVFETYHNYPYKSPQVFGEFIDNAIQSFEDNKNNITADPNYKLKVEMYFHLQQPILFFLAHIYLLFPKPYQCSFLHKQRE